MPDPSHPRWNPWRFDDPPPTQESPVPEPAFQPALHMSHDRVCVAAHVMLRRHYGVDGVYHMQRLTHGARYEAHVGDSILRFGVSDRDAETWADTGAFPALPRPSTSADAYRRGEMRMEFARRQRDYFAGWFLVCEIEALPNGDAYLWLSRLARVMQCHVAQGCNALVYLPAADAEAWSRQAGGWREAHLAQHMVFFYPETGDIIPHEVVADAHRGYHVHAAALHRTPLVPSTCTLCFQRIGQAHPLGDVNRMLSRCAECAAKGRCSECCGCYNCSECNTRHDPYGGPNPIPGTFNQHVPCRCGSACRERCTSCVECDNCGGRVNVRANPASFCASHQRCEGCGCACTQVVEFNTCDTPTFHRATARKVNPSRRMVSLEIEVANARRATDGLRLMDVVNKWGANVVEDGSLPSGGFEINTAPAAGDAFVEQMQQMGEALYNHRAQVTKSCGMHCHVDTRDFNYWDVRKLAILWRTVEPVIFRLIHPSREHSNYCRPVGEKYAEQVLKAKGPKAAKVQFFLANYGRTPSRDFDVERLKGSKYDDSRYNALNLHSWVYRGTVENRTHHGAVAPKRMAMWGRLNASILDFAYNTPERALRDFGYPARGGTLTLEKRADYLLDTVLRGADLKAYWQGEWTKRDAYATDAKANVYFNIGRDPDWDDDDSDDDDQDSL